MTKAFNMDKYTHSDMFIAQVPNILQRPPTDGVAHFFDTCLRMNVAKIHRPVSCGESKVRWVGVVRVAIHIRYSTKCRG